MSISGQRAYELLEKINFIRPLGEPGEKKAARILMEEIEAIGCKAVMEEFEVKLAHTTRTELRVTAPFSMECRAAAMRFSKQTPEEGISAPFAYVDVLDGNNIDDYKGYAIAADSIKLDKDDPRSDELACLINWIGDLKNEPDMASFLVREEKERNRRCAMSVAAADVLRMVRDGAERVHFVIEQEPFDTTSQNIVAELSGNEDIIVFGAHYDSVWAGPGMSDNGGGAVILMELLRHFAGTEHKQTLRFVWFGGEEEGFYGSKAYLDRHSEELKKVKLMINLDVAGSVIGHNFVRCTCEESVANAIQFIADETGYRADIKQGLMGSDSTPFANKGIPAIGFGRGAAYGFETAHSRFDIIDFISPKALEDMGAFIAEYAGRVLRARVFPIPSTIPENIVKRVKEMMNEQ